MPKADIIADIERLTDKQTLSESDKNELSKKIDELKVANNEPVEVLPSLSAYREYHTETALQKLCCEIATLCSDIYASTRNEQEQAIYNKMIDKIKR